MRHDRKHAALAAYAWWMYLERTGGPKIVPSVLSHYRAMYNDPLDINFCPACVQSTDCYLCPVRELRCNSSGPELLFNKWVHAKPGRETSIAAGDIANVMRKWCEREGVIAPRKQEVKTDV